MSVKGYLKKNIWIAVMFLLLTGCVRDCFFEKPLGDSYRAGFAAQVVNPDHPLPGETVDTMPGDLARKIHEKRYVPAMIEDADDDDDDKLSRQLR